MKKSLIFCIILILICNICCLSVAAESSPSAVDYYLIQTNTDGSGKIVANKNKVPVGSNESITLQAIPTEGIEFVKWDIRGSYEGDINNSTITIYPKSNILAIAIFSNGDGKLDKTNQSMVSPKTGQNKSSVFFYLTLMVIIALSIIFIHRKKIR